MKKTHKVVMLPTEDKAKVGGIVQRPRDKALAIVNPLTIDDTQESISQHLYILSDDTIKEGDWFINNDYGNLSVKKATSNIVVSANIHKTLCRKIIATTDPKLVQYVHREDSVNNPCPQEIPQIPQSFVESYAKNPVDKVELKYEKVTPDNLHLGSNLTSNDPIEYSYRIKLVNNEVIINDGFIQLGSIHENERARREKRSDILKVDVVLPDLNNKVVVAESKPKLYTEEDIKKAIKDFAEMNPLLRGCQVTDLEIDEWAKETL